MKKEDIRFDTEIQKMEAPGGMHICYLGDPIHLEDFGEGLCRLLGYEKEEFAAYTGGFYSKHILVEDREIYRTFVLKRSKKCGVDSCSYRMIRKDGTVIPVVDIMESVKCSDGIIRGYATVMDITMQKRYAEKYRRLLKIEKTYRREIQTLLNSSEVNFFKYHVLERRYVECFNFDNVTLHNAKTYHDALMRLKDPGDPYGKRAGDLYYLIYEEDKARARACIDAIGKTGKKQMELRFLCGDGVYRWFEFQVTVSEEDRNIYIGYMRNIDNRKNEIDMLRKQSSIDAMTGVYNKVTAFERIGRYLSENPDTLNAFIFLDIDNFKQINDLFGHNRGDEVITFLTHKLKMAFRTDDIIARFGGDEFIVFMKNLPDRKIALARAEDIIELCDRYDGFGDTGWKLSISGGVAFSRKNMTVQELFCEADEMLYKAKASHKGTIAEKE